MRGTSAQDSFPIHGNKRELVKTREEWINLVITALSSKYTGDRFAWGCLSETNLLFQISTLSYTRIPDRIVDSLVAEGRIWLKKDAMGKGYYECGKQVNKRRSFSAPPQEEKVVVIEEPIAPPLEQTRRRSIMGLLRRGTVEQPVVTTKRRLFSKE